MSATSSRRQRGATLVVVVMLVTSIAALSLLTITSATSSYKSAKTRVESTKAFYVAEGGMDWFMGQLAADAWWPARTPADFPVVNADGSFETDWLDLGRNGGKYKVRATYATLTPLPPGWTGAGFPAGFEPYTPVVFANRTDFAPTFHGLRIQVTAQYQDTVRTVQAGIRFEPRSFAAALISDAPSLPVTGKGKQFAYDSQSIVFDAPQQYIHGGIRSNGSVYETSSDVPLTDSLFPYAFGLFDGPYLPQLDETKLEIPDFTSPGSEEQLFDFGRFKAAADAGAGQVFTSLEEFVDAMNAANAAGTPLEGITYVQVDCAKEGNNAKVFDSNGQLGMSEGINVKGTLVFDFLNAPDDYYKVSIDTPININSVPLAENYDPADPSTYQTGYPPVLSAEKDPHLVDITSQGYVNFTATDDMPALMFRTGTVSILRDANICGTVYGPSFVEIENLNAREQFFYGTVIGGAGMYIEGSGGLGGHQVFAFDPNAVDQLPTFDNRGKAPVITSYAVGK
jgi:hypothetical protein